MTIIRIYVRELLDSLSGSGIRENQSGSVYQKMKVEYGGNIRGLSKMLSVTLGLCLQASAAFLVTLGPCLQALIALFFLVSSLNGNNGSYTNTDDHKSMTTSDPTNQPTFYYSSGSGPPILPTVIDARPSRNISSWEDDGTDEPESDGPTNYTSPSANLVYRYKSAEYEVVINFLGTRFIFFLPPVMYGEELNSILRRTLISPDDYEQWLMFSFYINRLHDGRFVKVENSELYVINASSEIRTKALVLGGKKKKKQLQPSASRNRGQGKKKKKVTQTSAYGNSVTQARPMPNSTARIPRHVTPVRMSSCVRHFILASLDPFSPSARGVCNPNSDGKMTMKTHAKSLATVVLGTNNYGWILISPTIANDCVQALVTQSTYTGSFYASPLVAATTFSTGVTYSLPSNLPFSFNSMYTAGNAYVPSITGRVVVMGIRCTYAGTELNLGGMYYGLVEPNHSSVSGVTTAAVGNYEEAMIRPITRRPIEFSIVPINANEDKMGFDQDGSWSPGASSAIAYPMCAGNNTFLTTFQGSVSYLNTTGSGATTQGAPIACILMTGVAGNTFQIEMITHIEYQGQNAQPMLTDNGADPQGTILAKEAIRKALTAGVQNLWNSKQLMNYAMDAFSSLMYGRPSQMRIEF